MGGILRGIYSFGYYRWLATIVAAIICILFPRHGSCGENVKIFNQIETCSLEGVTKEFDKLVETSTSSAQGAINQGFSFLQSFIAEINSKYGCVLTILDACKLVRENINALPITLEERRILLKTIEIFEFDSSLPMDPEYYLEKIPSASCISVWNWFTPGKKHQRHKVKHHPESPLACQIRTLLMEEELPSNFYVGSVEVFVGALICLLPFPGAVAVGIATMGDGARRVCDGLCQYSDERRADPNYVQPSSPLGLDF